MSRKCFRLAAVVIVLFAMQFAVLPVAEARGLSGSRSAVIHTDWMSSAVAWISGLLNGGSSGHARSLTHKSGASTSSDTSGTKTLNTGPCIDPMGGNCYIY